MNEQIGQLQTDLGLDERGLAMALGVDKRTLHRWISGDNYPQREARKRLQALVELHHALLLMWSNMDAARTWLHRPSPYLGQTEPIELVRAGRYDRVEAALEAINSGFAS
jgi:putative toxin-antitoxin system antitoxin component (TIGR02293 family)